MKPATTDRLSPTDLEFIANSESVFIPPNLAKIMAREIQERRAEEAKAAAEAYDDVLAYLRERTKKLRVNDQWGYLADLLSYEIKEIERRRDAARGAT